MKAEQSVQTPDDIELVPDAWDRFKEAVKVVAGHKRDPKKAGPGKAPKPARKRPTPSR